jgi:DNA transposition AAA+ family ATPase
MSQAVAIGSDDGGVGEARVRARLGEHLRGVSQAEVARRTGLSKSAVSQFVAGSYPGDNAKVAAAVVQYLDGLEVGGEVPGLLRHGAFVRTEAAREVLAAVRYTRRLGDIAVVYGDPGVGKTYTLQQVAQAEPKTTILFTAAPHHKAPPVLMADLAVSSGIPQAAAAGQRELYRALGERFRLLASGGTILIIDEAQHLSLMALEQLRSLHDATRLPLVLVGNELVHDRMHGSGEVGYAQLFSRVGLVRRLRSKVDAADVRGLLRVEPSEEAMAFLLRVGARAGSLRSVVKLLQLAEIIAADDGSDPLSEGILAGAYQLLLQAAVATK